MLFWSYCHRTFGFMCVVLRCELLLKVAACSWIGGGWSLVLPDGALVWLRIWCCKLAQQVFRFGSLLFFCASWGDLLGRLGMAAGPRACCFWDSDIHILWVFRSVKRTWATMEIGDPKTGPGIRDRKCPVKNVPQPLGDIFYGPFSVPESGLVLGTKK